MLFKDMLLIDCCIIELVEILMKMYYGMLIFSNFSLALITQIYILYILTSFFMAKFTVLSKHG